MNRIARHAGLLLAGDIVTRVVLFATTIFLARTLSTDGFGLIAFAQVLLGFLALIADWGLATFGVREVARAPDGTRRLWVQITILRVALSTVACTLAIGFVGLSAWDSLTKWVVALSLLGAVPLAVVPDWTFRGLERMGHAAVLNALVPSLTLLGLLVAVRHPADITAVPVVRFMAATAAAVAGTAMLTRTAEVRAQARHGMGFRADVGAAGPVLRTGTVLLAANLVMLLHSSIDVVLVRAFLDNTAVGLYSAAYRIIQLPMGAFYALTGAALPVLVRGGTADGEDRLRTVLVRFGTMIGVGIGLLVWGLREEIIRLAYGAAFAPSVNILGVLAVAIPLDFAIAVKGTSYIAGGRERQVFLCIAWAAFANVAANILLIPRLGLTGAAVATVLSYIALFLLCILYLDRGRR